MRFVFWPKITILLSNRQLLVLLVKCVLVKLFLNSTHLLSKPPKKISYIKQIIFLYFQDYFHTRNFLLNMVKER